MVPNYYCNIKKNIFVVFLQIFSYVQYLKLGVYKKLFMSKYVLYNIFIKYGDLILKFIQNIENKT